MPSWSSRVPITLRKKGWQMDDFTMVSPSRDPCVSGCHESMSPHVTMLTLLPCIGYTPLLRKDNKPYPVTTPSSILGSWCEACPHDQSCCSSLRLNNEQNKKQGIFLPCPHTWYIGLAKESVCFFFHKIKDIFFIFTNNFIDLDISSMSAISHMV